MIDWKTTEDKTELEAYAKETYGIDLDKRKSVDKLRKQIEELKNGMRKETQRQAPEEEIEVKEPYHPMNEKQMSGAKEMERVLMNDLATRIWHGQSISLPRHERERRIKAALIEKGYSDMLDKLELPK